MTTNHDLTAAYRATTFRVQGPEGNIDIRIGRRHAQLDALLTDLVRTEWAYITAWNPSSRPLTLEQNASAHTELVRLVRDRGLPYYEGYGIPDSEGWSPERSVWIAGLGRNAATAIGTLFGQKAIVVGSKGDAAVLLFCSAPDIIGK